MELTQENLQSEWLALSSESLAPSATSSETTQLTIDFVSADVISVSYKTMPGNQPNTYGNYIALWQNTASIPWNTPPLQVQKISTNTQSGSMVFSGLSVTNQSFIIGYAVGPQLTSPQQTHGNICSTAYIPASSSPQSPYPQFSPSLQLMFLGPNSVAVNYTLPDSALPMTNGAWIGIWRSGQTPYNNPPLASNKIQQDAASGTAFINNLSIGRGLTYTVALFTSGWSGGSGPNNQQPMACSVTFTNS